MKQIKDKRMRTFALPLDEIDAVFQWLKEKVSLKVYPPVAK